MNLEEVYLKFQASEAWKRFDEWTGISVHTEQMSWICFFSQVEPNQFKFWALRGGDAPEKFLKYRNGEWMPETGLDFATTDGLTLDIVEDSVTEELSLSAGRPFAELRSDEKRELYQCMDAVQYLVSQIDQEKLPPLGEVEEIVYRLWKVGGTWRAEVSPLPDPHYSLLSPLILPKDRMDRLVKVSLPRGGVWECGNFFLPAVRMQGDQEVFVQCAAVIERGGELKGLVTMEAHAHAPQEILEAILGSIETHKRIPDAIWVRSEDLLVLLSPLASLLGLALRYRRNLASLEHVQISLIDEFPEENGENLEE